MKKNGLMCKLCSKGEGKYVCPRCNIVYCSVECYQRTEHSSCSEEFYRRCVQEELAIEHKDGSKSMFEILQRLQQKDKQGPDCDVAEVLQQVEETDSDDGSDGEDLAARMAGVNLDDADTVWDKLTQEEKEQFQLLLASGDPTDVVPTWEPWWTYKMPEKPLVVELGNDDTVDLSCLERCPEHRADIPALLDPKKASSSVRHGVENAMYAFALMARYYTGDYLSELRDEAAQTLLQLSASLSQGQNFSERDSALASVTLEATQSLGLTEENLILGREDLEKILEGPDESFNTYYLISALSDCTKLLDPSPGICNAQPAGRSKGEFSRRFMQPSQVTNKWSRKKLHLAKKKIEFYIAWAKCQ